MSADPTPARPITPLEGRAAEMPYQNGIAADMLQALRRLAQHENRRKHKRRSVPRHLKAEE